MTESTSIVTSGVVTTIERTCHLPTFYVVACVQCRAQVRLDRGPCLTLLMRASEKHCAELSMRASEKYCRKLREGF